MTELTLASVALLAAGPLHSVAVRLAGLPARPPLVARRDSLAIGGVSLDPDLPRLLAALGALLLLAAGASGDVMVAALLVAVVYAGRAGSPGALAPLLLAAAAAVRVGSTGLADVAGAGSVLGPAVTSSSRWISSAGGFAVAPAVVTAASVQGPPPRRSGWFAFRGGPAAGIAVAAPLLTLLLGAAVAGAPGVTGDAAHATVAAVVRLGLVAVAVLLAAVVRRAAGRRAGALALLGSIAAAACLALTLAGVWNP